MRPSLFFTTSLTLSSHFRRSSVVHQVRASLLHSTTRNNDGTIIISPDDTLHSASVILCHGLGDTAMGWEQPAQYLANQLPHVKFILPTAPTQPVTLNMGMSMPSWYDIIGLDSRSNESCEGIEDSIAKIMKLVDDEVDISEDNENDNYDEKEECKSSLDYSRVVLAGFSQGGALALYTGMSQHRTKEQSKGLGLAGIVVMSGYLPNSKQFTVTKGSEDTPILHCHGIDDNVVPVQATEVAKARVDELVSEMGGDTSNLYQVKTYRGLDHSVSMEELNDVANFLKRVIPQDI